MSVIFSQMDEASLLRHRRWGGRERKQFVSRGRQHHDVLSKTRIFPPSISTDVVAVIHFVPALLPPLLYTVGLSALACHHSRLPTHPRLPYHKPFPHFYAPFDRRDTPEPCKNQRNSAIGCTTLPNIIIR